MTPRADSWIAPLPRVLRAARGPRRFLSDLQRQCSAIAAWRRSAAWLPQLLAQRPQLLAGPLFGHTLAAAVQGGAERAETPVSRTVAATPPVGLGPEFRGQRASRSPCARPPQSAAPRPRIENPGRRLQALSAPQATVKDRAPLPGQSRTRVERSLLTALAGTLPVAPRSAAAPARLAPLRPSAAGERHLPVAAESGRLVQQLVQRLRSTTLTGWPGSGASAAAAPTATPDAGADLLAQWALPLAGQRVSGHVLAALLQTSTADAAGWPPGRDRRQRPAAAQPAGKHPPSTQGPMVAAGPGVGHGVGPQTPAADGHPPGVAAPRLFSPRRQVFAAKGSEAGESGPNSKAAEPEFLGLRPAFPAGQVEQLIDPRLAPPPLPAGEPTPGGRFFAALRRQRPSAEGFFDHPAVAAGGAADDLEELTAKLQRILEEQARRHGIDV